MSLKTELETLGEDVLEDVEGIFTDVAKALVPIFTAALEKDAAYADPGRGHRFARQCRHRASDQRHHGACPGRSAGCSGRRHRHHRRYHHAPKPWPSLCRLVPVRAGRSW